MDNTKYIGMDVHKESISIAVLNSAGKLVMECVIETKASSILDFIDGRFARSRTSLDLLLFDQKHFGRKRFWLECSEPAHGNEGKHG